MVVNSNRFLRDCPLFQPDRREQNFIKLIYFLSYQGRREGGEGGRDEKREGGGEREKGLESGKG
jgi:hypothetical protein